VQCTALHCPPGGELRDAFDPAAVEFTQLFVTCDSSLDMASVQLCYVEFQVPVPKARSA
jgi:hypothetical protein